MGYSIPNSMPSPKERRKHPRIPAKIPVGVYLKNNPHVAIDAEILDISEGGAFVHCTAPIGIGQEVLIEIRFAETKLLDGKVIPHDELGAFKLRGPPEKSVVRWARGSNRSGFGIEFIALRPEKRKFVQKLVQYFNQLKKAGTSFG